MTKQKFMIKLYNNCHKKLKFELRWIKITNGEAQNEYKYHFGIDNFHKNSISTFELNNINFLL